MSILSKFENDGYVVLEDFLSPDEVEELRAAGEAFTTNLPPENERRVFDSINFPQNKDLYFLDSAHKMSYFFEPGALDLDGKLKVDPKISLNKVGHALHWLHPTFKKISFDDRVKDIARKLNFQEPAICQSMYIYKNPGIGSQVTIHQDVTYLYTEPTRLLGYWIALQDATLENGCLWLAPGSHKGEVHWRYMRNKDPKSNELLVYDTQTPSWPQSNFKAVPVKQGTCVLLHGKIIHYSEPNKSQKSRHAYTIHAYETKNVEFSKENWIQPPQPEGFPLLYKN
ncbi:phytanoyl-CoA dioxygenase domain-containing protein 1 homolog [Neodiprion fabricii]|uniref:phytanoyl-CoA dioxygenase domain-containing protein 1 homolog n=1 Tax=Neodiprion fabricii TaxID=2872261 RepID=UPI001ED96307|nr:phytanoyl-CoA dioxygenase domain-containing protein 1 homolog [Neodiprion fabricii]